MNLENSKQAEFLNDIRDVGMEIVFQECTEERIYQVFRKYSTYMDNDSAIKYLETLKDIIANLDNITPDDLLYQLGKYTKKIDYEDNIYQSM